MKNKLKFGFKLRTLDKLMVKREKVSKGVVSISAWLLCEIIFTLVLLNADGKAK